MKETWATIDKLVNKRSKNTNITALEVDGQANSDIPHTEYDLLNGDYDVRDILFHFKIVNRFDFAQILYRVFGCEDTSFVKISAS